MNPLRKQDEIILASKSPRRQYLLRKAGLDITVTPSRIDEQRLETESARAYVRRLATSKAEDVARRFPQAWVIGADTIVSIHGAIMGKPEGREDAREMLQRLSGETHQVYTGYCICNHSNHRLVNDVVVTEVTFKELSAAEIEWYIHTSEPFDKAGAYAIQGLGTFLVRRIHGSYTNVVGLPVCEVIEILIHEGAIHLETNHTERSLA